MNVIKEIPEVDQKHILVLDVDGTEKLVTLDTKVTQDKEYSETPID